MGLQQSISFQHYFHICCTPTLALFLCALARHQPTALDRIDKRNITFTGLGAHSHLNQLIPLSPLHQLRLFFGSAVDRLKIVTMKKKFVQDDSFMI